MYRLLEIDSVRIWLSLNSTKRPGLPGIHHRHRNDAGRYNIDEVFDGGAREAGVNEKDTEAFVFV